MSDFCILIAKEIFRNTFYFLYLMVPVLLEGHSPYGFYIIGGGMRYALGLLAVWFIIRVFKNDKPHWLLGGRYCEAAGVFNKY